MNWLNRVPFPVFTLSAPKGMNKWQLLGKMRQLKWDESFVAVNLKLIISKIFLILDWIRVFCTRRKIINSSHLNAWILFQLKFWGNRFWSILFTYKRKTLKNWCIAKVIRLLLRKRRKKPFDSEINENDLYERKHKSWYLLLLPR